jgi:hypothetical protein
MPVETQNQSITVSGQGQTVSQAVNIVSDGGDSFSPNIPASSNDVEVDLGSIPKANMKALFLMAQFAPQDLANATSDVTVYCNAAGSPGSGSPDQTLVCVPNVFGVWNDQMPFDNPLTGVTTLTKFYVNNPNTVPCTLVFKVIEDVTP